MIAPTPLTPSPERAVSPLLERPSRRLLGLFVALTAIEQVAEVLGSQIGQWATKPFLMPVLICLVVVATGLDGNRVVVAALALSTVGDILLLVEGNSAFMAGLIAVLGAQLCYIRAFASVGGVRAVGCHADVLPGSGIDRAGLDRRQAGCSSRSRWLITPVTPSPRIDTP